MKLFRCTCPDRYPVGSPGHTNVDWRDAQYVKAESLEQAVAKMRAKFPDERVECRPFEIGAS